jgi:hypothetical protein
MKWLVIGLIVTAGVIVQLVMAKLHPAPALTTYKANNPDLNYVGRIDYSDPLAPRFAAPGTYVQARFSGNSLAIDVTDEALEKNHNYIEVAIDNRPPIRLQTTDKINHLQVANYLPDGEHIVTICKSTETNVGYLDFTGITCAKLLPWVEPTRYKIEFIGNSITCGSGNDVSDLPCDEGEWYDHNNAYMSFAARTARQLNAQWMLTAYSGIGLMHSCCGLTIIMPRVYDRLNLLKKNSKWNFKKYVPDVVVIELGQNDGLVDSVAFCRTYINFIGKIRSYYKNADVVMLSSPMADARLLTMLKKYILSVETHVRQKGDTKVHHYFFMRSYHEGCSYHPNMNEHEQMAQELTAYLRKLKSW